MKSIHQPTPLLATTTSNKKTTIWLKLENLQPSGSFKLRGIGHKCAVFAQEGVQEFICASGGNAGIAVAYSGRILQIPVKVVVPKTTSQKAIQAIADQGASVQVFGDSYQQAHQKALELLHKKNSYIHAYDHPLVWDGHATLIDEVKKEGLRPDGIVLAVGGGGLLCGVAEGLKRNKWEDIPILAVETVGAHALAHSLEANKLRALETISSIATTLGASQVAPKAFEVATSQAVESCVVTDKQAVRACLQFYQEQQSVVEPACGAALSVVYEGHSFLDGKKNVLVIVCGGSGSSLEQLQKWEKELS